MLGREIANDLKGGTSLQSDYTERTPDECLQETPRERHLTSTSVLAGNERPTKTSCPVCLSSWFLEQCR